MYFIPTNEYTEVSLEEGLNLLQLNKIPKLYSDGLDYYEYIAYSADKGFHYEDGCTIGRTLCQTLNTLISLKWFLKHKFYFKKTEATPFS